MDVTLYVAKLVFYWKIMCWQVWILVQQSVLNDLYTDWYLIFLSCLYCNCPLPRSCVCLVSPEFVICRWQVLVVFHDILKFRVCIWIWSGVTMNKLSAFVDNFWHFSLLPCPFLWVEDLNFEQYKKENCV